MNMSKDYLKPYVEMIIKKLDKEIDYKDYSTHELQEYLNQKKEDYFKSK